VSEDKNRVSHWSPVYLIQPEYTFVVGSIRFSSGNQIANFTWDAVTVLKDIATVQTINKKNFLVEEKRVAWFKGNLAQIESFVKTNALREGSAFPMPSKLVVEESTIPFYTGQEPKINPQTKEIITFEGKAVYRNTVIVPLGDSKVDSKLEMDTVSTPSAVMQPNTSFAEQNK
jgi:hypothetical protein